ncbi:hypothetical protein CDL12_19977 [Handroanthus impetiginosus]|uniref:Knottin scorpion toxin-like domain-containing protein n=1 Tax=Handroanthus impetiginosus TaxID=429701 RepID=A0A2G9GQE8_9LAMI|nr:hypothetical protein CDL12_19977 [Handroanthus impetiginosus]
MGHLGSFQILAIFLLVLCFVPRFGLGEKIIVKCNEGECAALCKLAYKEKLKKSYCKDLPFGIGRICTCEHSPRDIEKDNVAKNYFNSNPVFERKM